MNQVDCHAAMGMTTLHTDFTDHIEFRKPVGDPKFISIPFQNPRQNMAVNSAKEGSTEIIENVLQLPAFYGE
jgi:hypothetical protein